MNVRTRFVTALVLVGMFAFYGCGRSDRDDALPENGLLTPAPPPPPDTRPASVTLRADGSLEEALAPLYDTFLFHGAIRLNDRSLTPFENPFETIDGFSVAIVSDDPAQRTRSVFGPVDLDLTANPMNPAQYLFVLDSGDPLWAGIKAAGVFDLAEKIVDVASIRGRFELTKELVQAAPRWGPAVWNRFRPSGEVFMGGSVFWDQTELPNSEMTFGFSIRDFGFDLLPGLRVDVDDEAQGIDRELRGIDATIPEDSPQILIRVEYLWDVDLVEQQRHLRQRLYCGDLRGRFAGGLLRGFISLPLLAGHAFYGNMELVDSEGGKVLPRILPLSEALAGTLSGEITFRGLLGDVKSLELDRSRATLTGAELHGSALYRAMAASGVFGLPERPEPGQSKLDVRFDYNKILVPDDHAVLPEEALKHDFPRNPNVSFSEIRLTAQGRSLIGAGYVQPDGGVHIVFAGMRHNRLDPEGPRLIVSGTLDNPQTRRAGAERMDEFPEEFRALAGGR